MKYKIRVLVIDDNQEILDGLRSYLGKKRYEVVTASDGLDGLKFIETMIDGFDLVITDIVMPNVSGIGVISIIKNTQPDLPIIAITGMGEYPENLAKEAQADVVLTKPFELKELVQAIKDLLGDKLK
jgi:CheY-like chemotaxis protein